MTKEELRTALAAYAHEAWSGWVKYQFSKCVNGGIMPGSLTIPPELVARWTRQMNTPFIELPAEEQESDFAEADKILELFQDYERTVEAKAVSRFTQELVSNAMKPCIGAQLTQPEKLPDGAILHYLEFNYAPVSEGQTGASK